MSLHLVIADWDGHDHYGVVRKGKGRGPLGWVKLPASLLDDPDFMGADLRTRCLYLHLLVLAARMRNLLPADPAYLSRVLNLEPPLPVLELVALGFIEPCQCQECLESRDTLELLYSSSRDTLVQSKRESKSKREATSIVDSRDPLEASNGKALAQATLPTLPEPSTRTPARPHPHVQPWHVDAVLGVAWEARRQFFAERNGAAPPAPKTTPRLRQLVSDAIKAHDSDLLEADRDTFLRGSRALAAGVGIYLDPWCTGKDPRGDGRLYLEPERPWLQQRGKPDPVGRFADLALQRRAALELLLSTAPEGPQETRS